MGSSYRGLRRVAIFRPYTSKQVGDTGPAESTRRRNLRAFGLLFLGSQTPIRLTFLDFQLKVLTNEKRDGLKVVSIEKSGFAIYAEIFKKFCKDPIMRGLKLLSKKNSTPTHLIPFCSIPLNNDSFLPRLKLKTRNKFVSEIQ